LPVVLVATEDDFPSCPVILEQKRAGARREGGKIGLAGRDRVLGNYNERSDDAKLYDEGGLRLFQGEVHSIFVFGLELSNKTIR
jgi:hypothetical protein